MDARTINNFRGYVGEEGYTASQRIKKWIEDYVRIREERDIKYLRDKGSIR